MIQRKTQAGQFGHKLLSLTLLPPEKEKPQSSSQILRHPTQLLKRLWNSSTFTLYFIFKPEIVISLQIPDIFPVIEDNALVILASASIQCCTFYWEGQLLVRASHCYWRTVIFCKNNIQCITFAAPSGTVNQRKDFTQNIRSQALYICSKV